MINRYLILITLILAFCYYSPNAQSNKDFQDCIYKITQLEDINETLFSFVDTFANNTVLCIESRLFFLEKDTFYVDRQYFEQKKENIYVESRAFIEMYDIDYWLRIDSVSIGEKTLSIYFKTTSFYENKKYKYITGKIDFQLTKCNNWKIINREFRFNRFVSTYNDEIHNRDSIMMMNRKMIEHARQRIKDRN